MKDVEQHPFHSIFEFICSPSIGSLIGLELDKLKIVSLFLYTDGVVWYDTMDTY